MTNAQRVRILLVDRCPVIRAGLLHWFSAESDFEICGEASGVRETVRLISDLQPAVVILEISLPDGDGLELAKTIQKRSQAKILFYSTFEEPTYGLRCLIAGAKGYVHKDASSEQLTGAIRDIVSGKLYFSQNIIERRHEHETASDPIHALTNRQLEIFRLIGEGKGTTDIAHLLHLSTHTVETHRENMKNGRWQRS